MIRLLKLIILTVVAAVLLTHIDRAVTAWETKVDNDAVLYEFYIRRDLGVGGQSSNKSRAPSGGPGDAGGIRASLAEMYTHMYTHWSTWGPDGEEEIL